MSPTDVGLINVTAYTFQGDGVQGSALSYTWDFGDDSRGTGPTGSHTYQLANSYTVRLTVSNQAGSATATIPVIVKSMTGRWTAVYDGGFGERGTAELFQNDRSLTGRYFDTGDTANAVIEASDMSGRRVQFRALETDTNTTTIMRWDGNLHPSADKLCGSFQAVRSFVMTRAGSPLAADFTNNCR